ncbi:MAG TPA: acyl-CoA desaturase [Gemmatimonadaceae bacterium]|nr:acyl-CoA desaturase [Gemmatimonadaceae bacterium]
MAAATSANADFHDDIIYPDVGVFVVAHLVCILAIWTGITWTSVLLGVGLYVVRMFAITAGYHRYFSHRSYKTSRFFQFLLALVAQSSTQKSVLWWAAIHRHHHKHSDSELDVHSPRHRGFWYSHVGWVFDRQWDGVRIDEVPDLAKYPELRFLQRWEQLPSIALAIMCFLIGGGPGVVVGFFMSTVVLYHCTFFINSLAHVHGNQRYVTGDDSRNNWWLAVITGGEGWHNNHHAYQRSCRQGFRWYEVDFTYYALKAMSYVGIVWELGAPPPEVVKNERPLGRAVIERVAHQLAGSFDLEHLKARLPHLPSMEELRARAHTMFAHTPSMDEVCARAREILFHALAPHHPGLSIAPA